MAELFKIARSDVWHAEIAVGPYRRKRAKLAADEKAAKRWHALLQHAVDRHVAGEPLDPDARRSLPERLLRQFGLISELADQRRATYAANVSDFIAEKRVGCLPRYVHDLETVLASFGKRCRVRTLADLTRERLVEFMRQRSADGLTPRSVKNEAAIVVAFGRWLTEHRRVDANPVGAIPRIDLSERAVERRALERDEMARLLAAAPKRALIYKFAASTGLRHVEIKRLRWSDVRLDDDRPHLQLRAAATKSRRADVVPLTAHLADLLRAHRPAGWQPTGKVFRVPTFATFDEDCRRAGIERFDADGVERVGFHSLRVTCGTELERSGCSAKTVAAIMRHKSYATTAAIYIDPRLLDPEGAVAKLPTYEAEPAAAVANGTDGRSEPRQQKRQQLTRISAHFDAVSRTSTESRIAENGLKIAGNQRISANKKSGRYRTRTCGLIRVKDAL